MGRVVIKRDKTLSAMAVKMRCYINGQLVCKLMQGEEAVYYISETKFEFKCNTPGNTASDNLFINMQGKDSIFINVKQGFLKPSVIVTYDGNTSPKSNSLSMKHNYSPSIQNETQKTFIPTKSVGNIFGIDESSSQWAIAKGFFPNLKKATPYSYDDILDFELLENGESVIKGGIGSAIVGGVIAGGFGAVVGAVTSSKRTNTICTSLVVKITVNYMNQPAEYIELITTEVPKNSDTYRKAYQDAQEILSLLRLICSRRDVLKSTVDLKGDSHNAPSATEEIRQFKSLLDDGIITEDEYQAKKKQLLGL